MMTESTLALIGDTQLCNSLSQPEQICPELFRECYVAHYGYVLQLCRRYFHQPEDAEDAAAEVFLKLYRVLNQKDDTAPFRPWLSQVARNHCVDKLRRRKSEKSSPLEENEVSGFPDRSTPSPLSQVLRVEERRRVREELIGLPAKYKIPLVLRYYKEMSYSDIARTMNRRPPAVRLMIFRAKDQLRRNLCVVPV